MLPSSWISARSIRPRGERAQLARPARRMITPWHAALEESAEILRMEAALAKAGARAGVVGPPGGVRGAARIKAEVGMVREAVANAR